MRFCASVRVWCHQANWCALSKTYYLQSEDAGPGSPSRHRLYWLRSSSIVLWKWRYSNSNLDTAASCRFLSSYSLTDHHTSPSCIVWPSDVTDNKQYLNECAWESAEYNFEYRRCSTKRSSNRIFRVFPDEMQDSFYIKATFDCSDYVRTSKKTRLLWIIRWKLSYM